MKIIRWLSFLIVASLLVSCGNDTSDTRPEKTESGQIDYARGKHGGRLLQNGDFALELVTYKSNNEPRYRLYAYLKNESVAPADVQASIELKRLDDEMNTFSFTPENDYLLADKEISKPHSFDVNVKASHGNKSYEWNFPSYEGRTRIPDPVAAENGIKAEMAGPIVLEETVQLLGNVVMNANRYTMVKARFPGTVVAVKVNEGDKVKKGQTLVVIEGNDSMRNYPLVAPFDGMVLSRTTSTGDIAESNTLLEIADMSTVWVELHALGDTVSKIRPGQKVTIQTTGGNMSSQSVIDTLLPVTTRGQSVVLRASLPNPDGNWRPGMSVSANVSVSERTIPLAVKESALQRLQNSTVVFAKIGDIYEANPLRLGARNGKFAEVLDGLKPGTSYVTEQSYLIKADLEKSGASHDD